MKVEGFVSKTGIFAEKEVLERPPRFRGRGLFEAAVRLTSSSQCATSSKRLDQALKHQLLTQTLLTAVAISFQTGCPKAQFYSSLLLFCFQRGPSFLPYFEPLCFEV